MHPNGKRLMAQFLVSEKARQISGQFSFIPKNSCSIQLTSHFFIEQDPTIGGSNPINLGGSKDPRQISPMMFLNDGL